MKRERKEWTKQQDRLHVWQQNKNPTCKLQIGGTKINQVKQFKYIGCLLKADVKFDSEIRKHFGIVKDIFKKLTKILETM